jgi:hypothetical protein
MKLKIKEIGMGLINAQNNDIILVGGMRSGNSSADVTRRKYIVYDKEKWLNLSKKGVGDNQMEAACNMGHVELFIKDGEEAKLGVKGLVNIEIKKEHRRNGIARKVINAIRETTGQSLEIHDIKKHVASTWRKLGVTEFHDGHGKPVMVSKQSASRTLYGTMPPLEKSLKVKKKVLNALDEGMSP